jgi:hypothetical protein
MACSFVCNSNCIKSFVQQCDEGSSNVEPEMWELKLQSACRGRVGLSEPLIAQGAREDGKCTDGGASLADPFSGDQLCMPRISVQQTLSEYR